MNVITAVFGGGSRFCTTRSVFQIDKGDVLRFVGLDLPEYYEVHFSNSKNALAKRVVASGDSVVIPWEFMRHGQKEVFAWIYLTPDAVTGYTPYQVTIPLNLRSDISESQPTPAQEDIVDEAIAALNEGVTRSEKAADDAEEATRHYPRIVNGYWQVWDADTQTWQDTGVKAVGEDGSPGVPGQPGRDGTDGQDGADGYSPTVTVADITGGHRVTITDETGPHSFDVMDGQGGGSSAVQSVNGKTGVVTLNASDVGALPDSSTLDDIPDGTTCKRPTEAQLQQIGQNTADVQQLQDDVGAIEGKIPAQASAQNPLADKAFVNSSIQTSSAHFRGNWPTWADVPTDAALYPVDDDGNTTPTSNDYMVVQDAAGYPAGDDELEGTWRFKYSGVWALAGRAGWHPEYQVNETPLTAAQLAALNSGATAELIAQITANETAIQGKQNKITASGLLKGDGAGSVSAATPGTDYQTPYKTDTLTIATTDWSNGSATKTVQGMTATALVWVEFSDTETLYSVAQAADALTFTVDTAPSEAVTVKVGWLV